MSRAMLATSCALALALLVPAAAHGQTDYYNTDRGRPVQVEDAYVTERHAFELKLAPVRLERTNGGAYNWGLEPEIALGILPRTQVELGVLLASWSRAAYDAAGSLGSTSR